MRAIGLRTTPANASVSKASNANKVVADVGGNLNVASAQEATVSAAHQSSAGGGFTISQTGGGASFSAQNGHADGNYAGVNEQAGIQADAGGFDVTVKGNTDLKGAYIGSTADPSKNTLTTSTLTTSDIENHSHYSANSAGFSAGASVGVSTKAVGPSSVSGAGGVTPMVFQNDSGDQSATTKSAVSAGTIYITKPGEQTQDVANLNRDATNLNGTVSKTPDVQKTLSQQADTMNAAQAAGQTISQGIGLYADGKRKDAIDAAKAAYERGDLVAMQSYIDQAKSWDEGGASRAELQMGGGALIGGLGGGSALTAIGGAAGAGMSSLLAGQAERISKSVGDSTGSSLAGNIAANVAATVGGALVGGSAGAAMASNVELYNAGNDPQKTDDRATIAGLQGLLNRTAAMASDAKAGVWNGMVNVAGVIVNIPNGGPFASPGDPGYVSLDGLKKPYKSGTSIGPDTEFWTPVLATLGLAGKGGTAGAVDAAVGAADAQTGTRVLGTADRLLPDADFAGRGTVRSDLADHLVNPLPSGKQLSGGHDAVNFESALQDAGGAVISKNQTGPGIYEVQYQLPGAKKPATKTIYDPAVYPDMPNMASEAANKALVQYQLTGSTSQKVVVNGIEFAVPIKVTSGSPPSVPTAYPIGGVK